MKVQKNNKTLILAIAFAVVIAISLTGCAKVVTPTEVSKTGTTETNVTANTTSVIEEPSETAQETTVAAAPEIIFSSLSGNQVDIK